MDGTLADSEMLHLRTLLAALEHHGITAGEELHPLIFGKTGREVYAICRDRFGIETDYSTWAKYRAHRYLGEAPDIQARPGALEVYRMVQARGMPQAIVSNASRMLLEANLRALSLQEPQLVSISANDVRRGKPDPEAYERAAYLLGIAAHEAIVVEDSPTGASAAIAAGMRVLGWPAEPASEDAARRFHPAVQTVSSARELAVALGPNLASPA
nr:HAD family phosphatase [Paraburkholderia sp. BCC1885]